MVSRTGCSFWITPQEFRGTGDLVALLDRRVDPSLRFALEDPSSD